MASTTESALRDAKSALKIGASDKALDLLIGVLMQFPKNSKALAQLTEVMQVRLGIPPRPFTENHIRRILQTTSLMGPDVASADAGALAALNPKNAVAQGFHAALLVEAGNLDAARAQFEATLAIDPWQVQANVNLANLLIKQEKFRAAAVRMRAFLAKKPDVGQAWAMLGGACESLYFASEAAAAFRKARALSPSDPEIDYHLGAALSRTGEFDEAIPLLENVIANNPAHFGAMNILGNIRVSQGDIDGARSMFERVLKVNPKSGINYYNLSRVLSYKPGDQVISDMLALDGDESLHENERVSLDFALAKALESIKDDEASFFHLKRGNDLRRGQLTYSTAQRRDQFERIKSGFARESAAANVTPIKQIPIFVLGMMRSGTSLTEQILSSHSKVVGAGELELMNELIGPHVRDFNLSPAELTSIREGYLAKIAELAPEAGYVVDKMPANFRWIGLIRKALPEARIIHLVRDPLAVCWSIYRRYFPAGGR